MSYSYIPADKIISALKTKLSTVRTGSVNSSILDTIDVFVPSYGMNMKISDLATVNIPEPGQLLITPFDKSVLVNIEKAITNSNLGVNPNNNGAGIRLVFPPMTEEVRKNRVKEIEKYEESFKIEVRNFRQDILKEQKKLKADGEISEDELKWFEQDLQKEVDKINGEIETIIKQKSNELMEL